MSDAVLVALITGLCAVLSNWLITRSSREKDSAARAKKEQETQDRLASIENKLDVHNGYAEKLTTLQADVRVIRTEIEHLKEAG